MFVEVTIAHLYLNCTFSQLSFQSWKTNKWAWKNIQIIIFVPPSSCNHAQINYHLKFGRDKINYSKLSFSHITSTLYFMLKICLSILQTVICLSINSFLPSTIHCKWLEVILLIIIMMIMMWYIVQLFKLFLCTCSFLINTS